MDKQAIAELEWEARREDAAQRPRTKEDLILTQQHIAAEMYYNPAAIAFAFGEFEKARFLIVDAAGREWEQSFLRDFDLKLVNEQGAMLCEGSVPMRACGPAAVFRWTAGEMFADVAARGAAMVRDAVKEHLAPKFVMVHKERDRFAVYNDREARKSEIKVSSTNHGRGAHAHHSAADTRAATADLADMALQFKRLKQAAYSMSAPRTVARECAACGAQFSTCPEYDPKWTDTYGKSATICSACYPKMTPAHAIIGGRIVETLPMPDEIRRGMVFWSKSWDHPDIHDGMLVTGYLRPMFGSDDPGWISTGQHFGFYPRNGHFLGCDPAHASPEDCERYGVAPGFEVKP